MKSITKKIIEDMRKILYPNVLNYKDKNIQSYFYKLMLNDDFIITTSAKYFNEDKIKYLIKNQILENEEFNINIYKEYILEKEISITCDYNNYIFDKEAFELLMVINNKLLHKIDEAVQFAIESLYNKLKIKSEKYPLINFCINNNEKEVRKFFREKENIHTYLFQAGFLEVIANGNIKLIKFFIRQKKNKNLNTKLILEKVSESSKDTIAFFLNNDNFSFECFFSNVFSRISKNFMIDNLEKFDLQVKLIEKVQQMISLDEFKISFKNSLIVLYFENKVLFDYYYFDDKYNDFFDINKSEIKKILSYTTRDVIEDQIYEEISNLYNKKKININLKNTLHSNNKENKVIKKI